MYSQQVQVKIQNQHPPLNLAFMSSKENKMADIYNHPYLTGVIGALR